MDVVVSKTLGWGVCGHGAAVTWGVLVLPLHWPADSHSLPGMTLTQLTQINLAGGHPHALSFPLIDTG